MFPPTTASFCLLSTLDQGALPNGSYHHPNGLVINNVFYWNDVLQLGRNDLVATDGAGNSDSATVYYKANGQYMPNEDGAKVINVTSNNVPAFFIIPPRLRASPSTSPPTRTCTSCSRVPPWISDAGFTDTSVTGRWRDNALHLVDYQLFKQGFAAGTHVALGSSPIDFVIIVK